MWEAESCEGNFLLKKKVPLALPSKKTDQGEMIYIVIHTALPDVNRAHAPAPDLLRLGMGYGWSPLHPFSNAVSGAHSGRAPETSVSAV